MSGQMPSYTPLPTSIVSGTTAGHSTHHEKLNAMYNALGDMHYYGTGFPNGIVSAPVGATYIDTTALNGAIEWKKATGTGNTGWIVLEGDTGWRDITADFANLEAVNPNDYGVYVMRNGNTIHLSIKAQLKGTWADGFSVMLPAGYRVGPGIGKKGNFFTEALQVAGVGRMQLQVSNIMSFVSGTVTAAGTRYYGSLSMPARPDEAWPTTLPGTAVTAV